MLYVSQVLKISFLFLFTGTKWFSVFYFRFLHFSVFYFESCTFRLARFNSSEPNTFVKMFICSLHFQFELLQCLWLFVDLLASCDHRLKLKTVHVLSALAFDIRSITGCSCLFFRPRVTIRVQVSFLRPGQGGACIFINLNTIYFWWVSCISDISKTRPYPGTQSHFRYRICPILLFLFFTSYLNWIYFLSHSFIYFTFTFNKNSLHKYPSSIAISFLVPGVRNLRLEILESKTRREIF